MAHDHSHSIFNVASSVRNFGIMQEYNERRNKKLINNFQLTDRPMYWVTSSRPSNFGDPLDAKTKADNWFDENRYVSLSLLPACLFVVPARLLVVHN